MMTRKDYTEVAKALRQRLEQTEAQDNISGHMFVGLVAEDLANIFARDNARFNRSRFMDACGVREDM